jgi:hypothetical protein
MQASSYRVSVIAQYEGLTLTESDYPTAVEKISTAEELGTFLERPSSKRYSSRL